MVKSLKSIHQSVEMNPGHIFESRLDELKQASGQYAWRVALRLNLLRSIHNAEKILKHNPKLIEVEKDSLTRGSSQLRVVLGKISI